MKVNRSTILAIFAGVIQALLIHHFRMQTTNNLKAVSICNKEMSIQFSKWTSRFGKNYSTPAEAVHRMSVFCDALLKIRIHNSDQASTYRMGLNHMSDLDPREFYEKYATGKIFSKMKESAPVLEIDNLGGVMTPSSVDWSKMPVINRVYTKYNCQACYSFAATQLIEAVAYIQKGADFKLSQQDIIDCTSKRPYANEGCDGGCVYITMNYVKNIGIAQEADYPYLSGITGMAGQCKENTKRLNLVSNYYKVPQGRSDLLKYLLASQPIAVGMDGRGIQYYSSGIYDGDSCSTQANNFMLLVGYGEDSSITDKYKSKYWIIKNNQGSSWGMGGYMRLTRSEGQVPGKCGITENGVYIQLN